MITATLLDRFSGAMTAAGLTPPSSIIADGRIHRFPTNGRQDDDAGWYILHDDDIAAGAFGDWRTGNKQTWCAHDLGNMTEAERLAYRQRMDSINRQREEEERGRHAQAAARAAEIWAATRPAPHDHSYLVKKRIRPHEVRVCETSPYPGWLVVPLRDADGRLHSLEFISTVGDKRFLLGGRKQGHFFTLGTIHGAGVMCLAEGFATGASVHESTGYAVAVSFDKGNLLSVAKELRSKYPQATILVCGDNDKDGGGQEKAREAAEAVNGLVAIPNREGDDWNDVAVRDGLEAVRTMITAVTMPRYTPSADVAHLHTPPSLARDPNILARFEQAVRACGVVGEERCAKLTYLALTSRLLTEPVSLAVKGLSSSGKSFTTETTLKFFPPTAYLTLTAMSERALIYMKDDFKHKTLVIFEAVALREEREKNENNLTAYFVRSLLSEGRISYPVTVRDKNEGFVTKTIVKEGPTNVILTTTATELHGENETRLLSIPTNDSQSQTRAVMLRLAEGRQRAIDLQEWHKLQDWLSKAECRVTIPYATYLAETIPPVAVRLRRDFKSLLRLIEAHAVLHQCTRERDADGRIRANESDYLAVRGLVADLIAAGVGATVPTTIRETVEVVSALNTGEGVTVKVMSEPLKLDRSATQRRVQAAREHGYLINLEERRGKPARYAVGEPMPDELELLPLSIQGGVQHNPFMGDAALHTGSPSNSNVVREAVQVCSDTGERYTDDSEVIDCVD